MYLLMMVLSKYDSTAPVKLVAADTPYLYARRLLLL